MPKKEPMVRTMMRDYAERGLTFKLAVDGLAFTYTDERKALSEHERLNLVVNRESFLDELRDEFGLPPLVKREAPVRVNVWRCDRYHCQAFKDETLPKLCVDMVKKMKTRENCGNCDIVVAEAKLDKLRAERHAREERANAKRLAAKRAFDYAAAQGEADEEED